jgi:hypothetical protein
MLKSLAQLEYIIENKVFRFTCDNDASTLFIKEALFQFQKYVGQIEDAAKAQQEASEKKDESIEEPSKEV